MNILVCIVILIIVGIILLSNQSPVKKKTRESFLKELADFIGGEYTEIPNREGDFQVSFHFEGHDFVFEDVLVKGFQESLNKAYLKVQTPAKLSLSFMAKEKSMRVKSDILIISEVHEEERKGFKAVDVCQPKGLEKLQIHTDNPRAINELFADNKVLKVFKKFQNIDNRGSHSVALNIKEGELVLEFHENDNSFSPNLDALRSNVSYIEDYCEQMLVIINKLKNVENPLL